MFTTIITPSPAEKSQNYINYIILSSLDNTGEEQSNARK